MSAPTVIEPRRGLLDLGLAELWGHRDLFYYLIWREIKVRYKQTVVGIAWAVIQPVGMMLIFSLVFGVLLKVSTGRAELPYAIFVYTALVPWTYFTHALSQANDALVAQKDVVTRVYFPRLLLPLSAVTVPLVDLVLASGVLAVLMAVYGVPVTAAIWTLPLFVLLAVGCALGMGLWLGTLNAVYRDFRFIVPFGITLMLYLSPVIYPSDRIPERFRPLYGLNPMAGVIEGFRWALLGGEAPPMQMIVVSGVAVAALLASGVIFFRRMEGTVTDVV